jgi:phosphoribosyl 1,2-cyclic phosphodiesterase
MKVKFWGTRGSIPTPISPAAIEDKIRLALRGAAGLDLSSEAAIERYLQRLPETVLHTIGGNTACVEVRAGQQLLILDAGSGLRQLGLELMKGPCGRGQGVLHLFVSHTHWDHIQGFPMFVPAFIPGNQIYIYSIHDLEAALEAQQRPLTWPVALSSCWFCKHAGHSGHMQAKMEFVSLEVGRPFSIARIRVNTIQNAHPGESYGFRIEHDGSSLVYATDSEYKHMDPTSTQVYVDFFQGADLLIFDAQYTLTDVLDKPDWGHSSPLMGAELAHRAGVRRLVLFHHDPLADDQAIYAGLKQAETYLAKRDSDCQVVVASEGMEIEW